MVSYGSVVLPIGMFGASFVLGSILIIGVIDFKLVNRLTIRLIAAIAFADLLNHIGGYLSITQARGMWNNMCYALAGFQMFTRTFYNLTNLAICFHLYRSLVLLKKSSLKFELMIWIGMWAVIIPLMLLYYFLGVFTGTIQKAGCNPGSRNPLYNKIFSAIAGTFCLITIIACLVTTIIGRRSLTRWINSYANSRLRQSNDIENFRKQRRKMAERSFLYPLATLITLPCEVIFNYFNLFGRREPTVIIAMTITGGLSGLLTAIAFLVDPASSKAFESAKLKVKTWLRGKYFYIKIILYFNL
jgi:hypothetical protein